MTSGMSIRVGINGLGRIGRYFLRLARASSSAVDVRSINSHGNIESSAHLIQYDSIHGPLNESVEVSERALKIGKDQITYSRKDHPEQIEWQDVDFVLECTGRFKKKEDLSLHLKNQVKKVIVAAPAEGADFTMVYGINHKDYKPSYKIISNASCTTNCLAPLAFVIHKAFGIVNGYMTTVHAYTSDQRLLDSSHKDLRRARSAALSMIPTTTGAVKAIDRIIPDLKGRLQGLAVRVPVSNVSLLELVVQCQKNISLNSLNEVLKQSSETSLKGILSIEKKPLVSADFLGSSASAVLDQALTQVHGKTAQIFAWYDNEAGYCHRLLDIMKYIGK